MCCWLLTAGGEQLLSCESETGLENDPVRAVLSTINRAWRRNPLNEVPPPDRVTA